MLPAQLLRIPPCFETGWLFYAIGTHSLIYYLGAATWSMMGWRRVLQVASTRCLLGRLHNFLASRVTFYDTLNDYNCLSGCVRLCLKYQLRWDISTCWPYSCPRTERGRNHDGCILCDFTRHCPDEKSFLLLQSLPYPFLRVPASGNTVLNGSAVAAC